MADVLIVGEHQVLAVQVKNSRRRVVAQEWGRQAEALAQRVGTQLAAASDRRRLRRLAARAGHYGVSPITSSWRPSQTRPLVSFDMART